MQQIIRAPQTFIYIPTRSLALINAATTWNIGRATADKTQHPIIHKPFDKSEGPWLKAKPLGPAIVQPDDKLYVLLCHEERNEFQDNKRPRIGAVQDRVPGWRYYFSKPVKSWDPEEFAEHLLSAGLNRDFRDLRLHVSFSRFEDDERGKRFVHKLAKALAKRGFHKITVTGYRGILVIPSSIGGDVGHRQAMFSGGCAKKPSETRYSEQCKASTDETPWYRALSDRLKATGNRAQHRIGETTRNIRQVPARMAVAIFGRLQPFASARAGCRDACNAISNMVRASTNGAD
ncbi:hypothetical protein ACFQU1_16990 [Chelatococcus sp. GCM10030263]|uniref:hypothetical protein n=1 Tax=Chelatococcus sp. GCM10030263 TaxID=3273387 RepID=UPI00362020E4